MRRHVTTGAGQALWVTLSREPQWTVTAIYPIRGFVPRFRNLIGTTWPKWLDLKEELLTRMKNSTEYNCEEYFPLDVVNLPQWLLKQLEADGSLKTATFCPAVRNRAAVVIPGGCEITEGIKLKAGDWSYKIPPRSG
jgi:hypothetical protein